MWTLQSKMGNLSFQKLLGPRADLNELEYIIALHQTCFPNLRSNATVSSKDIALFLRSKYGFIIDRSTASNIVKGLGGLIQKDPKSLESDLSDSSSHDRSLLFVNETTEQIVLQHLGFQGRNHEVIDAENAYESLDTIEKDINSLPLSSGVLKQKDAYEKEDFLDVVQLYSCLLIPTLLKVTTEMNRADNSGWSNIERTDTVEGIEMIHPSVSSASQMPLISMIFLQLQKLILSLPNIRCRMNEAIERTMSLRVQPPCIISDVLQIMLRNSDFETTLQDDGRVECTTNGLWSTASTSLLNDPLDPEQSVPLSRELVRHLLHRYGERDAALDETLITEMINCAVSVRLSSESLARALTSDIHCWNTAIEDSMSTTFFDVFRCEPDQFQRQVIKKKGDQTGTTQMDRCEAELDNSFFSSVKFSYLSSSIDFVSDLHYSDLFVVTLWLYYLFNASIYLALVTTNVGIECSPGFWCSLIKQLLLWLIIATMLTGAGVLIILPTSLGNTADSVSYCAIFSSSLYLVIVSVISAILVRSYITGSTNSTSAQLLKADIYACFSFGIILLLIFIHRCFTGPFRDYVFLFPRFIQNIIRSTHVKRSTIIKEAATHKINSMLLNAHNLHLNPTSSPLINFHVDHYEKWDGLFSSWRALLSNERHGLWIHSRLVIGQIGQIIAICIFTTAVIIGTEWSANYYDTSREEALNQAPGLLRDRVLEIIPEGWMIRRSFYTGLGFAIVDGIVLILIYIPSTVTTIMKFRCGYLPSLHDEQFTAKYRGSVDTITYNVGAIIFGMIGSQGLFLLFFGGIVFLFVWPVTSYYMALFAAWFLGLMVTIVLKVLLMAVCRRAFYAAMFRTNVRYANVSALAMEAWNLALSGGSVLSRLSQFLLASAFWLGRVDCFLLDQDVKLFGYRFDFAPINYRKEILVHEAHKHPYMDRLAGVYLTRLKHGRNFGSNAGSAWRRLFVLALNPWLMKYRCLSKRDERRS